MATIQGHCDAQFEGIKNLLKEQLESGGEVGASIVINVEGKNVVDIWGGHADEAKTAPWNEDTIANVWSSSKTIAAFAALVQVERGLLDLDAPVSKYWPEFAQNGKEGVLVRHFLSHTSGVSGWEPPFDWEELYDTPRAVAHLAAQAPWWEPGTASGYHALTMGHLIGELIRRTSGKSMKQFIAEDIAAPLQADFQLGVLEKDLGRVSNVIPPTEANNGMGEIDQDSIAFKTFSMSVADPNVAVSPAWRNAEVPAANGHTNARGLARILSAISLGGTVDGVKMLSQATIDQIFREQSNGIDLAMGAPLRFGIGYGIVGGGSSQSVKWVPSEGRICFWGGWGGSVEIMDLDRKITFTYVMNKMSAGVLGSERTELYAREFYKALGVEL